MAGYYGIMLAVCLSDHLSSVPPYFLDNNLSKCQWIFNKPGVCIDIEEVCFGIVNGQISSILTELSAHNTSTFSLHYQMITLVNISRFSPNLVCALI